MRSVIRFGLEQSSLGLSTAQDGCILRVQAHRFSQFSPERLELPVHRNFQYIVESTDSLSVQFFFFCLSLVLPLPRDFGARLGRQMRRENRVGPTNDGRECTGDDWTPTIWVPEK
jgi:hypothetical protein